MKQYVETINFLLFLFLFLIFLWQSYLSEISVSWVHPKLNKCVNKMKKELPEDNLETTADILSNNITLQLMKVTVLKALAS